MSYTLRQVQPLLNATELLLFSQSRRDRIGALTLRELRAKITRSRTLRDKFRDLYQRQTAATQRDTRMPRQLTGAENERTQKKAEIFADLLQRFEAQLAKVEAKPASKLATARAAKNRTAPKAATQPATSAKTAKPAARTVASKKVSAPATHANAAKNAKQAAPVSAKTPAARSSAPSSHTARAVRVNTLKEAPINKKVHASARARNARQQAKKDSR